MEIERFLKMNITKNIRKILKEEEQKSNYQKIIDKFKRILPDEYSSKLDDVFAMIKDFIESEGFVLKIINSCSVGFMGVRTKNYIIICKPELYDNLAELIYIIFHEIRHEIQMGEHRLNQINPLSGKLEDFEELYRIYWDMEMDAHEYAMEWVEKIGKILNLPKNKFRVSSFVETYPTKSNETRNMIDGINKTIRNLIKQGYDYEDLGDLPMIKNLFNELEDLF